MQSFPPTNPAQDVEQTMGKLILELELLMTQLTDT